MAVVSTMSNHAKYMIMKKEIDFSGDEFKTILMKDTFTFNKDTHSVYNNVSGEEVAQEFGYTTRGIILQSGELTEDDTNDKGIMRWNSNPTWTADGGTIGPVGAAIIFDETVSDDTVIGCIDFGQDYSVTDGLSIRIMSGELSLG